MGNCTEIEDPVSTANIGGEMEENVHIKRKGTVCGFCLCRYDDGDNFEYRDRCCSAKDFGEPGVNAETGYENCQRYKKMYNLDTGGLRTCPLRYDLYPFAKAAHSNLKAAPCML